MKKKIYIMNLIIIIFSLIGCQDSSFYVSSDLDKAFQESIAIEDVNQSLRLKNITTNEEIHKGDDVRLVVENVSESQITIWDNPAPISIYTVENGKWLNVENGISFVSASGNGRSLLSRKGEDQLNYFVLMTQPMLPLDLQNIENRVVRFLIIGQKDFEKGNSSELVASYIDVLFLP